jgi:hypothetical protein
MRRRNCRDGPFTRPPLLYPARRFCVSMLARLSTRKHLPARLVVPVPVSILGYSKDKNDIARSARMWSAKTANAILALNPDRNMHTFALTAWISSPYTYER